MPFTTLDYSFDSNKIVKYTCNICDITVLFGIWTHSPTCHAQDRKWIHRADSQAGEKFSQFFSFIYC